MPWLSDVWNVLTHKNVDISEVKQKIQTADSDHSEEIDVKELMAYIDDIEDRIHSMVKELKAIYKKFNITFNGFKSMDMACEYLRGSIKDGSEEAYNNLIKLESMVTGEQQRHLALIRMAVTMDGRRVIDQIMQNPETKEIFVKIFGEKNAQGKIVADGIYQRLWSEIHKLSEYILIHKNRVYH